ncbi:helix-turn-helix domain-containing protein [Oceanobacillus sp. J11TS1]|uniref:helix-turn-helix domain-containing protein n=1 Tax=Oceanobacillus sp. J11TS1 TaxID=2807191 RepID=UPI001B1D666F|nr:helix-turn-helix domain-containing protein [Oceanobacillus sp. J11TS1]GIO22032.1 XRE family transcriptional regulator [Oceanobacillus sp. J11TS1]
MDVGEKLKEARLAKDISLDSLQEKTKIQKRYLVAIEEGKFEVLPGKFYTRAFIKEYASAVGINPDELVTDHKEELPSTEEEENVQYSRIQRTRKESKADKESRSSSSIPMITVILLIIAIVAVAIFFMRESSSSNEGEPIEDNNADGNVIITDPDEERSTGETNNSEENNNKEETEEDDNQDTEENENVSVEVIEEGTGSSPSSVFEITNVGEEVTLTLESADPDLNTWLEVTSAEGESLFSGNFDGNESPLEIDISGQDTISLNIGNAPALAVTVNGTEIEYPNSAVHQRLDLQMSND